MALVENSKPTYYSEEDGDSLVQIQFFKMDTVEGFPLRVRTFLYELMISVFAPNFLINIMKRASFEPCRYSEAILKN